MLRNVDWSLVRKIARDAVTLDRVQWSPCDVLTTAHDNDRSYVFNGKHYSPLIDTLEDRLAAKGVTTLSVARIISSIKGSLAYGRVRSPEGAFARALIAKRAKKLVVGRWRYPFSKMEERIWGNIFDRTGARKVVGIQPSREMCVAARKRGVWVADMQHGVIADTHTWYGESFRGQEPAEYLPHCFLVWDPGSAEVLKWVEPLGSRAWVIGNPWVSRFLARRPDDPIVTPSFRGAEESFRRRGKPNVLVCLSAQETNLPNGVISQELVNVIRESKDRYNWILRLHPNQIVGFSTMEAGRFQRYYAEWLDGYADWKAATQFALPVVLSNIDLHVAWSSSVCIEAAHFGIRSALLNPRMVEGGPQGDFYRYYKRNGMVEAIGNSEQPIRDWLARNETRPKAPEDYATYDDQFQRLISFLGNS